MEKNSPNQALEQALAALKASEERFSELAENTEDVFYSRNASTGRTSLGDLLKEQMGGNGND